MYRINKQTETSISLNQSYVGETIEQKIVRVTTTNEAIKDGAPLTYTDRKEGVLPEFNIRTDRFDVAIEAMDKVSKTMRAKRESKPTDKPAEKVDNSKPKIDGKPEPLQGNPEA